MEGWKVIQKTPLLLVHFPGETDFHSNIVGGGMSFEDDSTQILFFSLLLGYGEENGGNKSWCFLWLPLRLAFFLLLPVQAKSEPKSVYGGRIKKNAWEFHSTTILQLHSHVYFFQSPPSVKGALSAMNLTSDIMDSILVIRFLLPLKMEHNT